MLVSLVSISLLAVAAYGQGIGDLGRAAQGAQLLGSASDVVPKCDAPIDNSCDDMSFNDIASKVAGGGLLSGAKQGILGGAAGGMLPGRRRRRLSGLPALPSGGLPGAGGLPGGAGGLPGGAGGLGQLAGLKGTSYIADPNGLGPASIQNKLHKCDQQNRPGGQFDDMKSKLASGDFKSLTNPAAIDAGDQCKKFMDTERQQCQMLKRQCCAFLNGGIKNPNQLSCVFKDIMATAGKVQAQNSACDTAQQLMKNPNNAGNILQGGAKGVGTGLVLNQGANKVLG